MRKFTFLLLAAQLRAQDSLSLRDAVRVAMKENKAIAASNAGIGASKTRIDEAHAASLPKLNYSESLVRSDNKSSGCAQIGRFAFKLMKSPTVTVGDCKCEWNSVESAHAGQLLEKRHRWWLNALAERIAESGTVTRRARGNDLLIDPLFFRTHTGSMTGLRAMAEEKLPKGS